MIILRTGDKAEQARLLEMLAEKPVAAYGVTIRQNAFLVLPEDPAATLAKTDYAALASLPAVTTAEPYYFTSRAFQADGSVVKAGHAEFGGPDIVVIAGPCAIESFQQALPLAERLAAAGTVVFRGGLYKPRTSPYSFQGLGDEGLAILLEIKKRHRLAIVTEAMDPHSMERLLPVADIIQIGSRNMQNFSLLKLAGQTDRPVLLKRGMAATLEEFLLAAEYIFSRGNTRIILCERGIRSISDHTRNTLDLSAVPFLKMKSHLPVLVDPSHGTGDPALIPAMSLAAVAAGADGLMLEVHSEPARALSDGFQSLTVDAFTQLLGRLQPVARSIGRNL